MLITIVSATPFEIQPTVNYLDEHAEKQAEQLYSLGKMQIRILVTGVGMTLTALQLGLYLAQEKPDLLINVGVAGALNADLELGAVVHIISERFGDLGAEDADGSFLDIHQMGLIRPDDTPFKGGLLLNSDADQFSFLPKVKGVTVNKVHGEASSIAAFKQQFSADVESMEGAAFFLAALLTETSFLAIRSISNYVEPRNRSAWKIDFAINNVNEVLIEILHNFPTGN